MFDKYTIEHDIKDVNLSLDENDVSEQITVNQFKYELSSTEDNKLIMTNLITGYSVELGFTNSYYNYEVVENGNKYYIVVNETDGIESTIYYSSFITKENMSNENAYLDGLKKFYLEDFIIVLVVTSVHLCLVVHLMILKQQNSSVELV